MVQKFRLEKETHVVLSAPPSASKNKTEATTKVESVEFATRRPQQQQSARMTASRPSLDVPPRSARQRTSYRKSTYTMLRVDEEALQKIRSDKDVELLSVESTEAGEHVVFISAKSDLGQSETTAIEKLQSFEQNSTRKNRSKSNAVNPNRRSIL